MCVYNHIYTWTLDLAKGLQILHLWEDSGIHGELLPRGCQINAIAVEWFLVVPQKKTASIFAGVEGEQVENKKENSAQISMLFHHLTVLGFCIEFLSAIVFLM